MASIASSVKALNNFLRHSKASFIKHHASRPETASKRALHVFMGNEALDLDSTVSSVLLANLYHHYYMDAHEALPKDIVAVDVLPLLPIDRRDFVLRTEADAFFRKLGIDLQGALFLDDLSTSSQSVMQALLKCQEAGQLRLTLTDHNVLGQELKQLEPSIIGIVDHHVDQTDLSAKRWLQEKDIAMVGSASTLIAERYLGTSPLPPLFAPDSSSLASDLSVSPTSGSSPTTSNEGITSASAGASNTASKPSSDFDPTTLLDGTVGNLLIGTILVDTGNLAPSLGKTTPRDTEAIDRLVKMLVANGDKFGLGTLEERTELFNYLNTIKFDLSSLTSAELLRRDYKAWNAGLKYGISSTTISPAQWLEKDPTLASTLSTYIAEQKIAFLLVLSAFQAPEFKREVIALPAPGNEALLEYVITSTQSSLTLSEVPKPSAHSATDLPIRFFHQADIKLSRKQVQPAVHEAVTSFVSKL